MFFTEPFFSAFHDLHCRHSKHTSKSIPVSANLTSSLPDPAGSHTDLCSRKTMKEYANDAKGLTIRRSTIPKGVDLDPYSRMMATDAYVPDSFFSPKDLLELFITCDGTHPTGRTIKWKYLLQIPVLVWVNWASSCTGRPAQLPCWPGCE